MYLEGSFENRVSEGLLSITNNQQSLSERISQNESDVSNFRNMLMGVNEKSIKNENNISLLDSRLKAFENRFNPPSPAISDASTGTSGLSVNVLGIGVMASNGTSARLQQLAQKINEIISVLREKELIENV